MLHNVKFTDISILPEPERYNDLYVAKCPDWCEEGYQICTFNGSEFEYDGQSNDSFMENIESWALFFHDEW